MSHFDPPHHMIRCLALFVLYLFTINAKFGEIGISTVKNELGLIQNSERDFDPYTDNGGTIIGLAGKDFVIIAADTRLADTTKYYISSRECTRIHMVKL